MMPKQGRSLDEIVYKHQRTKFPMYFTHFIETI